MSIGIFIPGNVPSSKNGRRWTGKYFIVSKQTATYYKVSKEEWEKGKKEFKKLLKGKTKPYQVSFKFIRKSKHKFDYINPAQTVQDQMVKFEWVDDDNADEIVPSFEEFEYDKETPGVYINVL
mgnify:FL=1